LTMSWRNGSTSVGESWLGEDMGVERSGPESEERDRRGPRSSADPTSRLERSVSEQRYVVNGHPLRWLGEHFWFL
jgi:hypothetical protein